MFELLAWVFVLLLNQTKKAYSRARLLGFVEVFPRYLSIESEVFQFRCILYNRNSITSLKTEHVAIMQHLKLQHETENCKQMRTQPLIVLVSVLTKEIFRQKYQKNCETFFKIRNHF